MKKLYELLQVCVLLAVWPALSQSSFEGFEGGSFPPPGWGIYDNGVGLNQSWTRNSSIGAHEGTWAAFIDRENIGQGNTSEDWLVMPQFTVPENGLLRFYVRTTIAGNQGTQFAIRLSTQADQGALSEFTVLQQWNEDTLTPAANTYFLREVDLSAYQGQTVYVAFVRSITQPTTALTGDRILMDAVSVTEACVAPNNLTAFNITHDSATLNWNELGNADSWEIEYGPAGFLLGTGTQVTTDTKPFILEGLNSSSGYSFYVRSICAADHLSPWSGIRSFQTLIAPPVCGGQFVDNGGATGNYLPNSNITWTICPDIEGEQVTVTFDSFNVEANYDALYVYDGPNISAPQISSGNPGANVPGGVPGGFWGTVIPGPFTSSHPSGCLTFRFRSDAQGNFAGWIADVTCAPPPTCYRPTALTVVNTTSTTANLGWNDDNGATEWELVIQPQGGPVPTAETPATHVADSNPFEVTGLTPGTAYEYYVRAVCAADDKSDWSLQSQDFYTLSCEAAQQCTYSFILVDSGNNGWSGNTMTVLQNGVPVTTFGSTFTNGGGPIVIEVPICDGIPFELRWNAGGTFAGQVGVSIENPFGEIIYIKPPGTGSQNTTLYNGIGICTAPDCILPTAVSLSNATTDSLTVSWTENGTAESWELYVVQASAPMPDASTEPTHIADSNPFVADGLLPGTSYVAYVRAICPNGGYSSWSLVSDSLHTSAATIACGGNFIDNGGLTGNYANGTDEIVTICPDNPGEAVTVTFTSFNTQANFDALYVFDGPDINAFQISSGNPAANVPGGLPGGFWGTNIPGPFTSTHPSGCLTFRFRSNNTVQAPGWTSIISCGEQPTCFRPDNLLVTDVTQTTATLAWTDYNDASQWEIIVQELGMPAPDADTPATVVVNTNPYTIEDLTPGVAYEFYVRAVCGEENISIWSQAPGLFNSVLCEDENKCVYTFELTSNGSNGWAGNTMNVRQGTVVVATLGADFLSGSGPQIVQIPLCSDGPVSLDWNTGGTQSQFVGVTVKNAASEIVFTKGPGIGSPGTTLFNSTVDCSSPNCMVPINVVVEQVTPTSAELSWTEQGSATQWEIIVQPLNAAMPGPGTVGTLVDSNPYLFEGLELGTTYRFYVRSVCDENDKSSWISPIVFTSYGPSIKVVEDAYNVEELIREVFVSSPCSLVSNINWSTGTNFDSSNGISYFESGNSDFDFQDGIVLSTGYAKYAEGPNVAIQSMGSPLWPGDNDLEAIVASLGQPGSTRNATWIEFDFVPVTEELNFNFIFASEEYGNYQCSYSDVFAFFLTDLATGTRTNLAVVPGTNTPVSVTTIRNSIYNTSCDSANAAYFDKMYTTAQGINPQLAPHNFNGNTVPLTASATVVPGMSYRIKMVIADYQDHLFDSAVFLEGKSFDLGTVDLGDDYLISEGNGVCYGQSVELESYLNPSIYTINWLKDGQPIANANGTALTVTESGTYTLEAQLNNTFCVSTDSIVVEFYESLLHAEADDLTACQASGIATFDLTENTPLLLGGQSGVSLSYHLSEQDALTDAAAITNAESFTNTVNPQTIYARLFAADTQCVEVVSFQLLVNEQSPDFTLESELLLCEDQVGVLAITPLNFDPEDVSISWTLNGNDLGTNDTEVIVDQAGIYTVTVAGPECTISASSEVFIFEYPYVDVFADVEVCDSYELPALTVGAYFNEPNGNSPINAAEPLTESQTVYVFAANNICTDETSFTVTVNRAQVDVIADVTACDAYTLGELTHGSYFTQASGQGEQLQPGTVITQSQTLYIYDVDGICEAESSFVVTINACFLQKGISPNGDGLNDFFDLSNFDVRQLQIFNRYGQKVYGRMNYSTQWLGQSDKGEELPTGTYYYMIELNDGEKKTGWIYINREVN